MTFCNCKLKEKVSPRKFIWDNVLKKCNPQKAICANTAWKKPIKESTRKNDPDFASLCPSSVHPSKLCDRPFLTLHCETCLLKTSLKIN